MVAKMYLRGIIILWSLSTIFIGRVLAQNEGFYYYELEHKNEFYEVTGMDSWNGGYYLLIQGSKSPFGEINKPLTVNRVVRINSNMVLDWSTMMQDVPGGAFEDYAQPARWLTRINNKYLTVSATIDTVYSLDNVSLLINWFDVTTGELFNISTHDWKINPLSKGAVFDSINNLIYFVGILGNTGDNISRLHIMQLDTQLNVLWQKSFELGLPGIIMRYRFIVTPLNELLIALLSGGIGWGGDYLVRLDSIGNLIEVVPGLYNQFKNTPTDLANHPNGNIVYMSAGIGSFDDDPGFRLVMMSPQLDTVWTHSYFDPEWPAAMIWGIGRDGNVSIAHDGRILVHAGLKYQHLLCFSPDGDLLWRRKILFDSIVPGTTYQIRTEYGAQWAEDGGIILSGVIRNHVKFDSILSRPYILKLDSLGCLHPDCDLWMTVSMNDVKPIRMNDACWKVWPNPATNHIYLHLASDCVSGIEVDEVVIHDLYGREVHRQRISGYSEVQMIDIGELPKGMYVLRLQSGPVILGVRQIVFGY